MVDLDSNPTKLIEIVEIGKQLLMTRGALTTFSIANDVAKYFAIIPAMFLAAFPALGALNIMRLRDAGVGDPVGRDLQRPDHRRAGAAGAARRAVPARWARRRCCGGTCSIYGARRHHRAVRRHQGDRRRHHGARAGVGGTRMNITRNLVVAVADDRRDDGAARASSIRWSITGAGPGGVPGPGQRPADRARRRGRRLADHRPGVLVAGLLPAEAVGGRHAATTPAHSARLAPRPDQQEADRRASRPTSTAARRRTRARRCPIDLVTTSGVRARSAHLAGGRRLPGAAGRPRARHRRRRRARLVAGAHRGPSVRVLRRAGVNVLMLNLALDERYPPAVDARSMRGACR